MGYQLIMDNQLISFTSNFYSKILFGFYILFVICPLVVDAQLNSNVSEPFSAVMLILVLFLKDFLRTYFISPCPGPYGSGPCPCSSPCGLVLVLVLVFSPCKDLFPLFHYSDLFA